MNEFEFSRQTKIILYGAASIGGLMLDRLTRAGFHVIGFIDKRAGEIQEFCGLPVWRMEHLPEELSRESDWMIFIAVKNVFEHDAIADALRTNGLNRLIYKPYCVLIHAPSEADAAMNAVYMRFFEGEVPKSGKVPILEGFISYNKDYGIISSDEGSVIAWIPLDFVFTNDYTDPAMKKWGNLNILSLFTHLEFFRFLAGDEAASPLPYLSEYCVYTAELAGRIKTTDAWKQNVFRNRAQIYREMNLSLQIEAGFFLRNAPEARWNDKGYFNLVSGKHRASFFAAKQYYYIPLRVSEEDYRRFLNPDALEKAKKCIETGHSHFLSIPHPYFYRMRGTVTNWYYGLLSSVMRCLARKRYDDIGRVDFNGMTLLLDLDEPGSVSAYFMRLGFRVYTAREETPLTRAVRLMGHIPYGPEAYQAREKTEFDVVIAEAGGQVLSGAAFLSERNFVICRNDLEEAKIRKKFAGWNLERIFNTFGEEGKLTLLFVQKEM